MAGDMPELNTDSFVDTIANTVGVLIVLVVVSIAMFGIKMIELNPVLGDKYKDLIAKQKDMRKKDTEISQLQIQVEQLTRERAGEVAALDKAQQELDDATSQLEGSRATLQQVSGSLTNLRGKREAQFSTVANLRAAVDAEERELMPKGAEIELLTQKVEVIQGALAKMTEDTERMDTEARNAKKEAADAQKRIDALTEELKDLRLKVDDLREQKGATTVTIHDPMESYDPKTKALRVECFKDETAGEGRAASRVAPLLPSNYFERGPDGKLRRRTDVVGEDPRTIREPDSAFRKWLDSKEGLKATHCLHFFVRDGGYAAFRAARAIAADERGWEVRWDPMLPGQSLVPGGATSPD